MTSTTKPVMTWEIKYTNGDIKTISGTSFTRALKEHQLKPFITKDILSLVRTK